MLNTLINSTNKTNIYFNWKTIEDAVENAEHLADPDGEWQDDLGAVCA